MNPFFISLAISFVGGLASYLLFGPLFVNGPDAPRPVRSSDVSGVPTQQAQECVDVPKPDAGTSPPTGVSVAKGPEVVPSPLSGTGASPFGINAQLPTNAVIDRMLDQVADAGIVWYRVELDWSFIEPKRGHFEWQDVDRLVDWAASRDVRLLAVLSRTPYWASFSTNMAVPPQRGQDFVAFVRQVAARYRGRIQAFSLWSKPNEQASYAGSQAFYIHELLIPGLRALREVAPGALAVGPDLARVEGVSEQWLEPILQLVPADLIDVVSQHMSVLEGRPGQRVNQIDEFRRVMLRRGYGQKPLWITETDLGVAGGTISEVDQARLLRETMADMAKRSFWVKTFWDDLTGLLEPQAASDSGVPHLSYFAYRDVIAAAKAPRPLPVRPGNGPAATSPSTASAAPTQPTPAADRAACLGVIGRLKDGR